MSENLTETFHGQEKFESSHAFDQEQQPEKPNETQIFELINQLNDAFANNTKQQHQQEANLVRSIEPISSESNASPIQSESFHSTSNNKSDMQETSNKLANTGSESKANTTKIPRIPFLRKSSMNEPTLTAKLSEHKPVSDSNSLSAASSNNSISTTASTNHGATRQHQQKQQRVARSTIKSAGNSSTSTSKDVSGKRGVSLSKNASTNSKARAASITAESREELLNSLKNSKQVKYVIKHQPKQSQVKIFSQKVELKNVSSKIGSLEKATYAPGGGNVKVISLSITSHELSWLIN